MSSKSPQKDISTTILKFKHLSHHLSLISHQLTAKEKDILDETAVTYLLKDYYIGKRKENWVSRVHNDHQGFIQKVLHKVIRPHHRFWKERVGNNITTISKSGTSNSSSNDGQKESTEIVVSNSNNAVDPGQNVSIKSSNSNSLKNVREKDEKHSSP